MFDPRAQQGKRDHMGSQMTMNSLRLGGLMVLAILAIVGLCFAVLFLWW